MLVQIALLDDHSEHLAGCVNDGLREYPSLAQSWVPRSDRYRSSARAGSHLSVDKSPDRSKRHSVKKKLVIGCRGLEHSYFEQWCMQTYGNVVDLCHRASIVPRAGYQHVVVTEVVRFHRGQVVFIFIVSCIQSSIASQILTDAHAGMIHRCFDWSLFGRGYEDFGVVAS
eukprot:TRINITY_DN12207_c1_g1_i4.p1 TRINITY_DN12207_c1_g1~~TRINITY_DN12207_c1_g1_i4.p1  ORF type:complete len:170 (-),score=3.55 TRINITY_DN12207_c1_g1_i4:358-867(-)